MFLQLNAFRHNTKLPDKTTSEVSVFTLTLPGLAQGTETEHYIYRLPGRDIKVLQGRYRA